ncbi:hypothetical protein H310_04860 [Aphanomyces invadans]|uniref:Uncharacterized protein n=1 Tax=Aphanomyces invadans TaxID=157072 RepID=A0A024UBY1_9STRA|nr:hypothetical protein H310_04860 [Aphanomyces invadans]ETW03382.1 hypothetical protein H310_04860 [Aphanomyces invadans]|eukprot:XP_008867611.1 hypothetical protein H310_04860 [Aphanomyces invadans]
MSMQRIVRVGSALAKAAAPPAGSRRFSQFIGGGVDTSSNTVTSRTNESIVFQSNSTWPWYAGKGAAIQVYAAAAFTAQILYTLPDGATNLEIFASAGPMVSASAFLFYGTKYLCERVVKSVAVCRTIGQRDEFMKVTVDGVFVPKSFHVLPRDVKLLSKDESGMYTFKIQRTTFWLDSSKAAKLEAKSLDILLSGKPLLVRHDKQSKQLRRAK